MGAIAPIVLQVLSMLPQLIEAGAEVVPLINATRTALSSGSSDPTDPQWQAVDAMISINTALINKDPA